MKARSIVPFAARLGCLFTGFALSVAAQNPEAPITVGAPLPRWTPGVLDIHHISTGRGNATFFVLPDSTTLLLDAGAVGDGILPEIEPHPDGSRTPGAWIVRYIRRYQPDSTAGLDYAALTHFHIDHMGQVLSTSPLDQSGRYRLTGITEVGDAIRIGTMLDRGWPDYRYPAPLTDSAVANYRRFLEVQRARGTAVERFTPGARNQIRLRHGGSPAVEIRNIIANGDLWTGQGETTRPLFPSIAALAKADWPTENMCSLGFRLTYGRFTYYTGGDLPETPDPGFPAWQALAQSVAKVVGPVDVHLVSHHGSVGAESEAFLRYLASPVIVIPSWAPTHPAPDVLKRILNSRLPPADRAVFLTDFRESAKTVIGLRADMLGGPPGHIVVRVEPGGNRYWVAVVSNRDESGTVLAVKGPFTSR